jgi:ABC-type sugar transport system ATPase subunit
MNFFNCSISGNGSKGSAPKLNIENGLAEIPMTERCAKWTRTFPNKSGLILGVRPEAVHIHREKAEHRFDAEVLFLEHFGSMNIINLQRRKRIFKARTRPTQRVESGERVWIEFDDSRMLFFDAQTGKVMAHA